MNVERTCASNPAQWDVTLDDGTYVYVRYRWGRLTMDHAPSEAAWWATEGGRRVFDAQLGGEYDGDMSDDEMRPYLEAAIRGL